MSDQYRDTCVNRDDVNRGREDPIRVSFYDKDGTRVNDITRKEARCISSVNPSQLFYFQDGNGYQRELLIPGVEALTILDNLPTAPACPTNPQPCGPPRVQFFGGKGVGAAANAIISPNSSSVIGFDIVNRGFNYLSTPFVELIDECGNGSGGKLLVQTQPYGSSGRRIRSGVESLITNLSQSGTSANVESEIGLNLEDLTKETGIDFTNLLEGNLGSLFERANSTNALLKILESLGKKTTISNPSGKGGLEVKNIVVLAPGDGYLPRPNGSKGGNGRVVIPPRDPNIPEPQLLPIVTFTASKYLLNTPERVNLFWNTENVTNVNITEIGNNLPLNSSQSVIVDRTKTYILTAFGPGGTKTSKVTISLLPTLPPEPPRPDSNLPPSVSFISSKYEVNDNEEFELEWRSSNVTSIEINQGIGLVNKNGNLILTIGETTTYTLTATGPGGVITQKLTVIYRSPIIPPEPPVAPPPLPTVPPTPPPGVVGPETPVAPPSPLSPPLPPQPPFPPEPPTPPESPGGTTYKVLMCLDEIYIGDGGFGFVPGDIARVVPENGSQVEMIINENGGIDEIRVLSKGCGYTDIPEIVIESETGYNAKLYPVLSATRITDEQELFDIPPEVQLVSVVDCVGIIPPKKEFDRVPR